MTERDIKFKKMCYIGTLADFVGHKEALKVAGITESTLLKWFEEDGKFKNNVMMTEEAVKMFRLEMISFIDELKIGRF